MDPRHIRLKGSRSKTEKNHITSVDRFMIAYAAVQVCLSHIGFEIANIRYAGLLLTLILEFMDKPHR